MSHLALTGYQARAVAAELNRAVANRRPSSVTLATGPRGSVDVQVEFYDGPGRLFTVGWDGRVTDTRPIA